MNRNLSDTSRKRDSSLKAQLDLSNGQSLIFTNTTDLIQLERSVFSKSLRLGQRTITFGISRIDLCSYDSQKLSLGSNWKVLLTIQKPLAISLKRKSGPNLKLIGGTLKVW